MVENKTNRRCLKENGIAMIVWRSCKPKDTPGRFQKNTTLMKCDSFNQ